MSEHAKNEAVTDFFAANVAFHELLCELSGNKKLLQVHHRLAGEIGRFQARTLALRGSLDGSVTEHRAILAAIRLRDAEKAAELTAAHVRVPAQRLLESVSAGGETVEDGEASRDTASGTSPGTSQLIPSTPRQPGDLSPA